MPTIDLSYFLGSRIDGSEETVKIACPCCGKSVSFVLSIPFPNLSSNKISDSGNSFESFSVCDLCSTELTLYGENRQDGVYLDELQHEGCVKPDPARIANSAFNSAYALDIHTLSSEYLGEDEFGHPRYKTTRSDAGELLYQLKYNKDSSKASDIAQRLNYLLENLELEFDCIVLTPPSRVRTHQPVRLIAEHLSNLCGRPVVDCLARIKDLPELKDIADPEERACILKGSIAVKKEMLSGFSSVLVLDDLYRSGATAGEIGRMLREAGIHQTSLLCVTKTRVNR